MPGKGNGIAPNNMVNVDKITFKSTDDGYLYNVDGTLIGPPQKNPQHTLQLLEQDFHLGNSKYFDLSRMTPWETSNDN